MNISIVTVYNSNNFGSFWQAKCLSDFLRIRGYNVSFIKTGARSTVKGIVIPYMKNIIKSFFIFNFKKIRFYSNSLNYILQNLLHLKKISIKEINAEDVILFGSDEIWNAKRSEMINHRIFFGDGIKNKKVSYAVSINNADVNDLVSNNVVNLIEDFSSISVRDMYSKEQINLCCDKDIYKVLDPTLLFPEEYYLNLNYKRLPLNSYIAIYIFNITENQIIEIKKVAKKLNKKIVSIGYWYDWCDYCVTARNPFVYYKDAEYIITNTFHGTAFAINLKKQFVVDILNKRKIKELMTDFHLNNRILDTFDSNEIISKLVPEIDTYSIDKKLREERKKSLEFLMNSL